MKRSFPALVALAVMAMLFTPGCSTDKPVSVGDTPPPEVTYRVMNYGASYIARNRCGGSTLIVKPGQTVVWVNLTDADRKIEFDASDKLIFGVPDLVIPKGDRRKLVVDDTLPGHPTHQYRFRIGDSSLKNYLDGFNKVSQTIESAASAGTGTVIPDGPPGIIVCPPNQTCG